MTFDGLSKVFHMFKGNHVVQLGLMLAVPCFAACSSDPAQESKKEPPILDATVSGIVIDENLDVVPGLEVCVFEQPEIPCATTDSLGKYNLGVPSNQRLVISYEKDDFVSKLRVVDSGEAGFFSMWYMQHRAWYDQQAAIVGKSFDPALGMMSLQALAQTGVTVAIAPAAGDGPYYADDHLSIDPALQSTGTSGVAAFVNLPPGKYQGSFSHPSKTCAANVGDGGSTSVKVPVRAGTLTHIGADCQ